MSFTHAIMFHHFHDANHLAAQGSLSYKQFDHMLDWLDERYNLIGANEYLWRLNNSALQSTHVCLSFDDALLCQQDIAIPALSKRELDAFFFVYSSVFSGTPDYLEIFRYFRTNSFSSMGNFYECFFKIVTERFEAELDKHKKIYPSLNYLSASPFYTHDDKWFRYLRDQMLGYDRYEEIMFELMSLRSFNPKKVSKDLWMSERNLQENAAKGHVLGLHSYSHPTQMSKLTYDQQRSEYARNFEHLEGLLGVGVIASMSHPCGNYNDDTLQILSQMKIQIGFRANTKFKTIRSHLEVPREDHANVFKEMQK